MHTAPRKKRNSAKINLIFSAVFHGLLIFGVLYFAAREGVLGKKLKVLAVQMTKKEKKPEEEKKKEEPKKEEKPPEEKPETVKPKFEQKVAAVRPAPATVAPPAAVAPQAAPPPVATSFTFTDSSAKQVNSSSDPVQIYKSYLESVLRSGWNRPDGIDDSKFEADVDLVIDSSGKIAAFDLKKGSGDGKWDASVKAAIEKTKSLRAPPKNFPTRFMVRFDTTQETEEPLSMGKP